MLSESFVCRYVPKMYDVSGAPSCCSTKYSYNSSTGKLTGLYILALVDSRAEQVTEWGCYDDCLYVRWGGYLFWISIYNISMYVGWVTRHTSCTVFSSQAGTRHLVSIMDSGRAALHYLLLLHRVSGTRRIILLPPPCHEIFSSSFNLSNVDRFHANM